MTEVVKMKTRKTLCLNVCVCVEEVEMGGLE